MKWFKLYTEARNDPKLRSLTDAQRWTWFTLLCLASEQPVRGTISGYSIHHLSIEIERDQETILSTIDALQALRSVTWRYEDDTTIVIVFTHFENRQRQKPSDDRERVRERVARSRNTRRNGDSDKPLAKVSPCNAPVSPCNALRDLDLELESPPTVPPLGDSAAVSGPASIEDDPSTRPARGAASGKATRKASEPAEDEVSSNPAYLEAMNVVRQILDNAAASRVGRGRKSIDKRVDGKWECVTAAARKVERDMARPGARSLDDPLAMVLKVAFTYAVEGIPETPRPKLRAYFDGGPALPTNRLVAPSRQYLYPDEFPDAERPAEAVG